MSERTRLIRASSDLLDFWGTRDDRGNRITAEWGEPIGYVELSDEYVYEPMFTVHTDRSLLDDFLASPQAAEELARARHNTSRSPHREHDLNDCPVAEVVADYRQMAVEELAAWQKVRHPEETSR